METVVQNLVSPIVLCFALGLVGPDVADRILSRINEEFLENYAVIAYVSDVTVPRRGKFATDTEATPDQPK